MNRASCQNVTFLEQSLVSVSDMPITQGIRGNPVPSGLKT
ncbi:unnamed protein product [Tenebrio molitor]|nr:unnamed protein product [Tenebrio molitor]